jgi:hypothetical protein
MAFDPIEELKYSLNHVKSVMNVQWLRRLKFVSGSISDLAKLMERVDYGRLKMRAQGLDL